ncbi:hypothetical protein FPV67DRAFT_1673180 [Lyophyllum atratum]|nr:hypothetical protein FPV67DRAFT_1673180 [Lyophyllum atratum]
MALNLNYDLNTYLAVTLSSASPFFGEPAQLALVHPAVAHVGQVGQLEDVQIFSVPKFEWERVSEDVLKKLKEANGVGRVDVQKAEARTKRGTDELDLDHVQISTHTLVNHSRLVYAFARESKLFMASARCAQTTDGEIKTKQIFPDRFLFLALKSNCKPRPISTYGWFVPK